MGVRRIVMLSSVSVLLNDRHDNSDQRTSGGLDRSFLSAPLPRLANPCLSIFLSGEK